MTRLKESMLVSMMKTQIVSINVNCLQAYMIDSTVCAWKTLICLICLANLSFKEGLCFKVYTS